MSGDAIEGARLRLRPVRKQDIPLLFEWYRDPELMTLYDAMPFAADNFDLFESEYAVWLDNDAALDFAGAFMMELREGDRAIGECTWMLVDRPGPESPGIYHVGGLIGPRDLRNKGYGTEALGLLRDWLFREKDAHRLETMAGAFNTGAMKTLRRSGFVREGVLREAVLTGDDWRDRVLFSLLRREWEQGSPAHHEFPAD